MGGGLLGWRGGWLAGCVVSEWDGGWVVGWVVGVMAITLCVRVVIMMTLFILLFRGMRCIEAIFVLFELHFEVGVLLHHLDILLNELLVILLVIKGH